MASLYDFFHCICCSKKITTDPFGSNLSKKQNPIIQMWASGGVSKIELGYGSIHDGDIYYLCVCDKCIDEKFKSGHMVYVTNQFSQGRTKEEIENAERHRQRQKNIEDLTD